MKTIVILPTEVAPVKRALEAAYESAIAEIATGTRLEYVAGKLAAVSDLIDTLETQYAAMVQGPREIAG